MSRSPARWLPMLLVLAGCDPSRGGPCSTAADCDAAQHCLVDHELGEGECVATPGRDIESPPLRWFGRPSQTDLLMVVDDGPDAAALQARLVASLEPLADRARLRHNDLRVAVTTTTVRSPVCESGSLASSGSFAARSCLDRLDDFIGADGTDARGLCTDVCGYTSEQLGLDDGHPWLDLLRLPSNIDPADALACLVPQGISGCEYASPLEALHLAREREYEGGTGWLRAEEITEVVIATRGVDCSVTAEGVAAFDPQGERALWSDPDASSPTPAVCWTAGVECDGDPAAFDDCMAVERAIDGSVTDDEPSVLEPLSTYRQDIPMRAGYEVHAIVGVPASTPDSPSYSANGDPAALLQHGIDPGCSDGEVTALPPVRLRDFADELVSACAPDYGDMLGDRVHWSSSCLSPCEAEAVEITYAPVDGGSVEIPVCTGSISDLRPPAGAPACWHVEAGSADCASRGGRTSELRLRTAMGGLTGAFELSPNPFSPEFGLYHDCAP